MPALSWNTKPLLPSIPKLQHVAAHRIAPRGQRLSLPDVTRAGANPPKQGHTNPLQSPFSNIHFRGVSPPVKHSPGLTEHSLPAPHPGWKPPQTMGEEKGIFTTLLAMETSPALASAQHAREHHTHQCSKLGCTYLGQMKAGCWGIRCQVCTGLWPLLCFPLMHCGQMETKIRALNLAFERQAGEKLKSCQCFSLSPSQN